MTSSRRLSASGKRNAARDPDPGRPVIGDVPEEAEEAHEPEATPPRPKGYLQEIAALEYLVAYAKLAGLPLAAMRVGDVEITFGGGGGAPTKLTGLSAGEPADLYRQYGGQLYEDLVARLSKAADVPR